MAGDSVTADTPILCRVSSPQGWWVAYRTIQQLGTGEWVAYGDKQECAPLPGYEVWTDEGFTPIHRVIRHACGKPLKRVVTPAGLVDVTTDHSLLTPDGQRVRPDDVAVGQSLLHAAPPPPYTHAGTWDAKLGTEQAFLDGDVLGAYYTTEGCARKHYYSVDDEVLNAPRNIREAYWAGFTADQQCQRVGAQAAAAMVYLAASLGIATRVTVRTSKIGQDTFCVAPAPPADQPHAITAILDLPPYHGHLYDLETANHRFAAGIGALVVHNTDAPQHAPLAGLPPQLWVHVADHASLRACCDVVAQCPHLGGVLQPAMAAKAGSVTLHSAALQGHLSVCQWLAKHLGLSTKHARTPDAHSHTALQLAAYGGHLAVCKWLTERFYLTAKDARGKTPPAHTAPPLWLAARKGHLPVCKWLAERFKMTAKNARADRKCVLQLAARRGDLEMCQWLTQRFELVAKDAEAALASAVKCGHLATCQWLTARFGLTAGRDALSDAARGGHLEVCQWLTEHFGLTVADARRFNNVALRWAAKGGHLATCQWLAKHFELTTADACMDKTAALGGAAGNGHLATCQWLTLHFQLTCQNARDSKALGSAAEGGHLATCQWLAKHFELTAADARDSKALSLAANGGHLATCQWLAKHFELTAADARTTDTASMHDTALHKAVRNGHLATCQWLTAHFRLTSEDVFGDFDTALSVAAKIGHLEMCQWLTEQFGLTAADARKHDNSALQNAAGAGHLHVCQWLVARFDLTTGAIPTLGYDVLHYATNGGHLEVCQWLAERFGMTADNFRALDNASYRLTHLGMYPRIPIRDYLALALSYASRYGHWHVHRWLKEHFGLTDKDGEIRRISPFYGL
jgi:hypothetical protein